MNLLLDAVQEQQGSPYFLLIVVVLMFAFIYFFQWRPNKKRQQEFKRLLDSLETGSEVLLNGGLIGIITRIRPEDDLIQVKIAEGVNVTTKRGFVVQILPKGTLESITKEEKSAENA